MRKLAALALVLAALAAPAFAAGDRESAADTVTLTWWHSNSGALGEAADALVEEFNGTIGAEEGIYVEAIYQGSANDTLTKVRTAWQAGDTEGMPDVVQLDATGVVDMAANEDLLYVEDLAASQGDDLSFIIDQGVGSMRYKGKVIGLPFNASTILFYYNKTAFDEAGVEVPRTLGEFAQIAPALVQRDASGTVTRHALANVPTTYELCSFIGMQNGGTHLTDMANGHEGTPTRVLFDSEGTLANFLSKWRDIHATGGLNNLTSGVSTEFAAGRTAAMFASTSSLTSVLEAIGGRFELGVAPMPMVDENATGGVNLGGGALFTFKSDGATEAAVWTFMKFLTSAEAQLEWHIATGYLPVNKDTYEMEEYKAHCEANPLFQVASDQLLASNPEVVGLWIPNAYQVYYSFQSNIRQMLEENLDIDATVAKLAAEINGYLNEFSNRN